MMMMLRKLKMLTVLVTKASVLTIEDTGVTQTSLAAPGLVNTLVMVCLALCLLTGEAGGPVVDGGCVTVQI